MNLRYRKTVIAGNWKMNMNISEVRNFIAELRPHSLEAKHCEVVLCVPFTHISAAVRAAKGTKIQIGAQNCHFEKSGAFTGEVSAQMLQSAGCKYVIIGHSERRELFGETDKIITDKVNAALEAGLRPILCVGEPLTVREQGSTLDYVRCQLRAVLSECSAENIRKITIAYEPIWAIGTGLTATAAQAEEVCECIRTLLRTTYGARVARGISILYGGSMNAGNAAELLAREHIDGGLIGGASLKVPSLVDIISGAKQ